MTTVTVEIPTECLLSYIAALDIAIGNALWKPSVSRGAVRRLTDLREQLMETYITLGNERNSQTV